jgi:predicted nuclease of predicted toxin-antitoxin system
MRFLLDAICPGRTAGTVQRLGHDAVDVRDVGLGGADDSRQLRSELLRLKGSFAV